MPLARLKKGTLLGTACALILVSLLVACLWPFRSPKNAVTWLDQGNGVRLGKYGTIFGRTPFAPPRSVEWSVELWLRSERVWQADTLLAFYSPDRSGGFSIHQSNPFLLIKSAPWNSDYEYEVGGFYTGDVFREGHSVFLTVASGTNGTRVYIDGELARAALRFRTSPDDLSGRLVLGNSPVVNDSWSGELRGLALYDCELSAEDALRHFHSWTATGRPRLSGNDHPIAIYLFDEHSGDVIHNRAGMASDLQIPARYGELHQTLLRTPWDEYRAAEGFWHNAVANVGGFVPLGFVVCAYFLLAIRLRRPALATIGLGFLLSLAIEILQAYLPTRDSGMMDVITNTLGTGVGVLLFRVARSRIESLRNARYAPVRFIAQLFSESSVSD